MAEFQATVQRIVIEAHPNADVLEIAIIGGYHAIVPKGQFTTGDMIVYIPEQAIVPEWLIKELGLEGRLAGKQKNRVKIIKLRGSVSQGLVYHLSFAVGYTMMAEDQDGTPRLHVVHEGQDVTDILGIVKWEPPIPTSMSGQVYNASGKTLHYDIENWKKHPDVIKDGEPVVFTEKLHGTWCCFGYSDGEYIVTSKGMSARGLAFKLDDEDNQQKNLYVRQFLEYGGKEALDVLLELTGRNKVYILGEIFGRGVQDLAYGLNKPTFRVFDIYYGDPDARNDSTGDNFYQSILDMIETVELVNSRLDLSGKIEALETVPIVARLPFSVEAMQSVTTGPESVSQKATHIREGVVIRLEDERDDPVIRRIILKSVSEDYLLRKGNVTEYQ